jgi:hypothetical protein
MLYQEYTVIYDKEGECYSLSWQYVLASENIVYPCVSQVKRCYMYIILWLIIQENFHLMFLYIRFSLILCSVSNVSVKLLLFRIFLSLVFRTTAPPTPTKKNPLVRFQSMLFCWVLYSVSHSSSQACLTPCEKLITSMQPIDRILKGVTESFSATEGRVSNCIVLEKRVGENGDCWQD